MKMWYIPFTIIFLFLTLSILNHASYINGVHDCSNMAVEQYNLLSRMGLDPEICIAEFNDYNHAWIKVYGYEYDVVSLMPMWVYRINNEQLSNTLYFKMENKEYPIEWQTNYNSYYRSIIMLFILIFFNILHIKVIRPVIRNEIT